MDSVIRYYEKSNEESRLNTDNVRKIEFEITTRTLDNLIKPSDEILELGAATGVYSFYYAKKGNSVVATDITPKHIDTINKKLVDDFNSSLQLSAQLVNATDLSKFESNSFNVVLCLGPMYHLTTEEGREKCIKEALRVLKDDGLLAIAYINKHYILNTVMLNDKKYLHREFIDKIFDTGVIKEGEKDCFWTDAYFTTPDEIQNLVEKFDVKVIDHLGTDGLNRLLNESINNLNDHELDNWLYYVEKSCRDKNILGISNHGLIVCRKRI
jgi:ubiquinone/menaquinone biosynthesis C-methylase UbiE